MRFVCLLFATLLGGCQSSCPTTPPKACDKTHATADGSWMKYSEVDQNGEQIIRICARYDKQGVGQ